MTGIAGATGPDHIPIALLDPTTAASAKTVQGIVTLIWPYSVSSQTFSILLAEPDFRLRRQRGQVRVHFRGSSAKALAKCDVQSGDLVNLSLLNAQCKRDGVASGTPGRGIEWELCFDERVVLQVRFETYEAHTWLIGWLDPTRKPGAHQSGYRPSSALSRTSDTLAYIPCSVLILRIPLHARGVPGCAISTTSMVNSCIP